jgi:hypothetical protein
MKRYALKGINEDQNICAVCGKVELRRVMWLVELDADGNECGEAFHCGTTCGAKLLGYTQSKINTKIKNYSDLRNREYGKILDMHPAIEEAKELEKQWLKSVENVRGFTERMKTYPREKLTELRTAATEWANQQPILVEL